MAALSKQAPVSTSATSPPTPNEYRSNAGTWGNLIGTYIFLEAPQAMVDTFALPSTQPKWSFPAAMLPELPAFLKKAGMDDTTISRLVTTSNVVREADFVHLVPTIPEVESLPALTRAAIYTELAKYPVNEYHTDPVLIIGTSVREWYASSKLRPDLIAKIEKLSYLRGDTIAFSDISVLLNYAQSDSEARQIFKSCTRTRSLMIRLRLDKSTNVEDLISYWSFGVGIRRKDIEPIIQSIIESQVLSDLPLSHVLPSLARKLLYTYPGLDMAKNGLLPDCHWTSLNFFNFEPHQYLLDSRLATSQVLEQFLPVEAPYQFGDVLFFLDSTTGDAFHSCVHLADQLVYSKNGRNILSPWVIMTLEDVKKVYLYRGNGRVQGFRRKDIDAARKAGVAQ
ncbi:MAG: hypothetical protein JNG86_23480 [Verrucomicrobiaceae bacterium]|nr:hypothetical protein [Verrucomicrobiaceae bacterium]